MSRYHDAFETIAERGTARGATALLERLETELSNPALPLATPRRRMPAMAVAAVAFFAVLVGGLAWGLLVRPGTDVTDGSAIEWIELDVGDLGMDSVAAGPGGFVRGARTIAPGGPRVAFEFSEAGRTWTEVEVPGLESMSGLQTVASSKEAWLLTVNDGDRQSSWISRDGMNWSTIAWPEGFADTIELVAAGDSGFLAVSYDVFDEGITIWWSSDGAAWNQIDGPAGQDPRYADYAGTSGGALWMPFSTDTAPLALIYHTTDGISWVGGQIEPPPEYAESTERLSLSVVEYLGDRWIALGTISRESADRVPYVWTSFDGIDWTPRGVPEFGAVPGRTIGPFYLSTVVDGRLVVVPMVIPIAPGEAEASTLPSQEISKGEVWSTVDGITWVTELRTDKAVSALAGRVDDDGNLVGVWVGEPRDGSSGQPIPATTSSISISPQELDPAGLELQAEILADGEVTREEIERALEGWKECMEELGFEASWEIDPRGGASTRYGSSPDGSAGETESALCEASFLMQVHEGLYP